MLHFLFLTPFRKLQGILQLNHITGELLAIIVELDEVGQT
jgi:hypothetical protein